MTDGLVLGHLVCGGLLLAYSMWVDGVECAMELMGRAAWEAQWTFIAGMSVTVIAFIGVGVADSTAQRDALIQGISLGEPWNGLAKCGAARESCDGRG